MVETSRGTLNSGGGGADLKCPRCIVFVLKTDPHAHAVLARIAGNILVDA